MKNIWAPWRKEFILSKKDENCFFCEAIKDNQDRKNLVLYRGEECFCILNKYPYNNGHLMVAPNLHKDDLPKLSSSEMLEIMTLTRDMKDMLSKKMSPDGFNLGFNLGKVAGAGVEGHIHMHIVPRWKGDTNFMPVVSDTKVIPQSLDDLYLELKNSF
ncbi:MAG: AP-4-A phosphorylase [Candidatus Scalindua arabica]|uniref:AP-4-A phosphorylase n=1 Tax=Candidatus Scalindua arabica TaxID=1127984 RepID=A0A942A2X4_9BACT|nr:AP-4-A phosphorylase [Candidatus Scalindua arabica]